MVVGLAANVPAALLGGLSAHGVPLLLPPALAPAPDRLLFAAFLGYNPLQQLLGAKVLGHYHRRKHMSGEQGVLPSLIGGPFKDGIVYVLIFAAVMCAIAAVASWMRGASSCMRKRWSCTGRKKCVSR